MEREKHLGVVFTPKNIARFMSKISLYHYLTANIAGKDDDIKALVCQFQAVDPELTQEVIKLLLQMKVLEPAAGEAYLLIEFLNFLLELSRFLGIPEEAHEHFFKSIYAFEINESIYKRALLNIKKVFQGRHIQFFHGDFFEVIKKDCMQNRFDIILANPPYIKEKENKVLFEAFKNTPYYQGRMDIWYMFMQYSIDILKDNGVITYIIPNNWITSSGARLLRQSIKEKAKILSIIDFENFQVFKEAFIQTMILTLNKKQENDYHCLYKKKLNEKINHFMNLEHLKKLQVKATPQSFVFTDIRISKILNKIDLASNFRLQKMKEITQGIVHPQNSVSKANIREHEQYKLNQGVFVVNAEEKEAIHLSNKEKSIVKPTFTTKELKRYFRFGEPRYWTIYTDKTFNEKDKIEAFPNIKKHLDQFKPIMTSDYKPYGLHRKRKDYFFKEGEKILVARKSQIPTFTYLNSECYPTFTFNVIKSERINMKYLTALLNSNLMIFWLKYKGKLQGNHFQIDVSPLLHLPIFYEENMKAIQEIEKKFDYLYGKKLLDKIIIQEINNIIYSIYGLHQKEIAIIEQSIGESHGKYLRIKTNY